MKGMLINRGTPELAKVLAQWGRSFPNGKCAIICQMMGGVASRIDVQTASVPFRTSRMWIIIIAKWDKPQERERCVQWSRDVHESLAPFGDKQNYGLLPTGTGGSDSDTTGTLAELALECDIAIL